MKGAKLVFENFFTHKDFLPPPDKLPGTLFSPLQIIFCILVAAFVAFAAVMCAKKSEKFQKRVFFILWLIMIITEPLVVLYSSLGGEKISFLFSSDLSLWPCSIFLYTAPFAIFGKGDIRTASCGYICTLGLLGGLVNFFYPSNYLSYYSCFSMAGFRTIFYHGAMVFTALTMIISGYHSFRGIKSAKQLILPLIPALIVSIPSNIVNLIVNDADYMLFKLKSFFLKPIGDAIPTAVAVMIVYLIYTVIHIAPYLPSYISNKRAEKKNAE